MVQNSTSCRVEVTLSPGWKDQTTNDTLVSINVNVYNTANVAVAVPWTLNLTNPYYGAVQQVQLYSLPPPLIAPAHIHRHYMVLNC